MTIIIVGNIVTPLSIIVTIYYHSLKYCHTSLIIVTNYYHSLKYCKKNSELTIRVSEAPLQQLQVVSLAQDSVVVEPELLACGELPLARVTGKACQVVHLGWQEVTSTWGKTFLGGDLTKFLI